MQDGRWTGLDTGVASFVPTGVSVSIADPVFG